MNQKLKYPIKFTPILHSKIWGGEKLKTLLSKNSDLANIGESWEVSAVSDSVSVVSNGGLKGTDLKSVLNTYTSHFLGQKVFKEFGLDFPLLLKFIDASENLSIQLHPNDKLALERHNAFGKTEMWYVMDAEVEAKLYAGFNASLNKETYLKCVEHGNLLDVVRQETVTKGDAYFIETGTIHAIGKGVLLAEIQQSSDITYRVFDWNRRDAEGKERELHTELALDALDFSKTNSTKIQVEKLDETSVELVNCNYFTVNKLNSIGDLIRDLTQIDSFVCYMCVSGEGDISVNNNVEHIKMGETIVIPAIVNEVAINDLGHLQLLEIYI